MSELEEVLKKVENKLILSRKVYAALTYQVWIVIMAGYYLLIGVIESNYFVYTAIYWVIGFIIYFIISGMIIKRIKSLWGNSKSSRKHIIGISLSWIIASVIGWFAVPNCLLSAGLEYFQALAIGLLSFISLANLGMIISVKISYHKFEPEMYPGTLIPALSIPLILYVDVNPMYYAGMAVVVGYGLTVVLYLYNTFKYSG